MVINLTKFPLPQVSWKKIKDRVLFKEYDLSLVFAGDKEMKRINRKYRQKNKPANVLSFGFGGNSGEIFLNLPLAHSEAKAVGQSFRTHIIFLYIHALLHLKGFKHNTQKEFKIMNKAEKKWLKILS